MLTKQGCRRRQERLFERLPDEVDWVVIADPRHVNYFSAFFVNPVSFSTCERALLILERAGRTTLVADNFTRRAACVEPFVDRDITGDWYDHRTSIMNRDHFLSDLFGETVRELSTQTAGRGLFEQEWLSVSAGQAAGLDPASSPVSVGTLIRELRRHKEDDELALLEQCMRACESGHSAALEFVRPGVTELDVFREVQSAAVAEAGRAAIVYGDFRSVNASVPKRGGLPGTASLTQGELFILDYSVQLDGYRSDLTNTISVGSPADGQQQLFAACVKALEAAEKVLAPEVAAVTVWEAMNAPLVEAGFPELPHHAGHGIGLGHPEPPILVPDSDDSLSTGDVVTLEPGAYVRGLGGVRVEHNYLITPDGCRRMSQHQLSLNRD